MSSSVTINPSSLSAVDLYLKGREIEIEAHAAEEGGKLGTLRGGSAGCLNGHEVYGKCHRLALARFNGLQPAIEDMSYNWFDAGFANEDAWTQKLGKSIQELGPDYSMKCEEECPVSYELDGVKVTGRPDLMVFKGDEPVFGLELKVVCTINSAIGVYCEDKPKTDNLIQAAHYSIKHGCPFSLVYSFRSSGPVPFWANKYKDKLRQKKKTYYIDPFIKEFKIGIEDGNIFYITDSGEKVDTVLSVQGIEDYYRLIIDMNANKSLFYRPAGTDLRGKSLPYDACSYCPLQPACDQFESSYDDWMDKVRLICEEEK